MKFTVIIGLIILTIFSCQVTENKYEINGSWYGSIGSGGLIDSLVNYTEVYITDSTFEFIDEITGQGSQQSYYIKKDSLFKCWTNEPNCEYIPILKIERLKNDTLWLTINKEYIGPNEPQRQVLLRLPKNEFGYYDHHWTKENSDSLKHAVYNNWHRRMYKFHSYRLNEIGTYDSLVKAGYWDWSMKIIREDEQKEIEYQKIYLNN